MLEDDVEDDEDSDDDLGGAGSSGKKKKKDKKLVFLSRSVLQKIRERPMTTGTQIANEILELYKRFSDVRHYIVFLFMLESGLQECLEESIRCLERTERYGYHQEGQKSHLLQP